MYYYFFYNINIEMFVCMYTIITAVREHNKDLLGYYISKSLTVFTFTVHTVFNLKISYTIVETIL